MPADASFSERRPYAYVALLELTVILVLGTTGIIVKALELPDLFLYGMGLGALSLVGLISVAVDGGWRAIGFTRLRKYHLLWLPLIPAFVHLYNHLGGGFPDLALSYVAAILLITLLSGFMEELFYRGLMLRALAPRGPWVAALVPSILFGMTHLMNSAAGWSLGPVLWQLGYSFAVGFGYAAFVIRTGCLWPMMIVHFLVNFSGLFDSTEIVQTSSVSLTAGLTNTIYILSFLIYGIVLIRQHIEEDSP